MPGIIEVVQVWAASLFYGAIILIYVVKQCFVKGFRQVFHWKVRDRPAILTDPSFGVHGFLDLKDVRIHYVASGPEDKPLMLFVHGFPEFWYSWRHQIREFQKDYRVVAIDQRGYNDSSKPSDLSEYALSKMVSDIDQVITALGYKSCILVGHDWGGLFAWTFAKYYPERVDKMIVMNAPPGPVIKKKLATNKRQQKKSWYIFFFQLPWFPEWFMKHADLFAFDELFTTERNPNITREQREENIEPYKYVFSQPGNLTPPINYYRNFVSKLEKKMVEYELVYKMPILLIWGCQDIAIDISVLNSTIMEVANIDVKRIPDASHFVQFDAPDEVNEAMREWLQKQKDSK